MTFADLKTEVELLTKDEGYFDLIPGYINAAYAKVAADARFPELKSIETVVTTVGGMTTKLTTVFGQVKLLDSTIAYYNNLESMVGDLDTVSLAKVGPVERLCIEGNLMWYWPVPATPQSITMLGYKQPALLALDTDIPECLPEHLQYRLLVHGASRYIFSKIEDGVDGAKVNTEWSEGELLLGMKELYATIGRNRNHTISSVWRV
jgi:hypothetical protein